MAASGPDWLRRFSGAVVMSAVPAAPVRCFCLDILVTQGLAMVYTAPVGGVIGYQFLGIRNAVYKGVMGYRLWGIGVVGIVDGVEVVSEGVQVAGLFPHHAGGVVCGFFEILQRWFERDMGADGEGMKRSGNPSP